MGEAPRRQRTCIGISSTNIHQGGKLVQVIDQSDGTTVGIIATQKCTSTKDSTNQTTILADSNAKGVAVGLLSGEIDNRGSDRLVIRDRWKHAHKQ